MEMIMFECKIEMILLLEEETRVDKWVVEAIANCLDGGEDIMGFQYEFSDATPYEIIDKTSVEIMLMNDVALSYRREPRKMYEAIHDGFRGFGEMSEKELVKELIERELVSDALQNRFIELV
jgi:hypothetical protein